MTDFSFFDFGIAVLETAIGATLGFGLGLIAFHYQHKREKVAAAKEARDAGIDALNRVTQAVGLNIEALANYKIHNISELEPEVAEMKTAVEAYYDANEATRHERYEKMVNVSNDLRSFYQSHTPLQIMPAPDFREFSMFVQEMPPLTSYLHRAMSTMREINENVSLRNSLIAGHALEGAEGMTPERYAYYASMLSGLGDYLCQSVDNDLQFFSLTTEQIELFMMARNKGGNHLRFELNDRVSETIPKEDLFPTLRAQMTTFNDPPEN